MKKIVVLGAGHGGILAAIKLASKGYDVTVLEQNSRGNVSHDWEDDIRFDIFQFLEIDPPPKEVYSQKLKWRFISPDEKSFYAFLNFPLLKKYLFQGEVLLITLFLSLKKRVQKYNSILRHFH